MPDNVVEFPQNEGQQQDEAQLQLPEEVQKQLDQYDVWVQEFAMAIDKALMQEAQKSEQKRDITLPLEALIRTFSLVAQDLDNQVAPEELGQHTDLRVELANKINQQIGLFTQSKPIPIYQQDIFLAFSYVLISYLTQQRIYTIDRMNGGAETDANQNPTE